MANTQRKKKKKKKKVEERQEVEKKREEGDGEKAGREKSWYDRATQDALGPLRSNEWDQ